MHNQNEHRAVDHHLRSLTTILKGLRRIPSSSVAPSSPLRSTRHLRNMSNLCNVLVRTWTEVIAATAAIEPHKLSLILSSTKKEDQSWLSLQEPKILFSANSKEKDALSSLPMPGHGPVDEIQIAKFVLEHLVWDLCFQSHGENAIRLLKCQQI